MVVFCVQDNFELFFFCSLNRFGQMELAKPICSEP